MSNTAQPTGALAIFNPAGEVREFALKVGTTTKQVVAETMMVLGGKQSAELMREAGYALAMHKAKNGNYRAAVEIVSLAASKAIVKVCAPAEGTAWNKASTMFLCQKTLEIKPKEGKGFGPKALKGRVMAQQLLAFFEGQATPDAPKAEDVDPLTGAATGHGTDDANLKTGDAPF